MWKLDLDSDFFRILDKDRKIAGYFWPDYGQILPENKYDEIVEKMHKNHDPIPGGFVTVPMVKFGIFDNNQEMDVLQLSSKIDDVHARMDVWKEFLLEKQMQHSIQMSHTDNDMLSLSFPVKFSQGVPLEKEKLLDALSSTLDLLSQKGLL
ncbi:hypothetical protein [Candidatus Nitrosotenuis aquarius]|uniref:hypothetical protein n=1 Tax=Candidatus Nitrosotenuis aquarius TaxID=1846278 RepID=UPI000C1F7945|nr:hypothetical protein [Candidatus Nitrosotenuis aquarius]